MTFLLAISVLKNYNLSSVYYERKSKGNRCIILVMETGARLAKLQTRRPAGRVQ